MKHRLFALLVALRAILDRHFAIKVRFAMAQVHIYKCKVGHHVILSPKDRLWLLSIGSEIDHDIYDALGIVTPQTYRRWVREAKLGKTPRSVGRKKKTTPDLVALILRMLKENSIWGIHRISGELKKLAMYISASTVARVLVDHGKLPPPDKDQHPAPNLPWSTFLSANMNAILVCDFFTKPIWTWRGRFDSYCLFFKHLGSRKVWVSPATFHPDEDWVMQQARNVSMWVEDQGFEIKHLIHDNDTKFTAQFDRFFDTLRDRGKTVIKTAICAPNMNAYAETFVGTIKRECLGYFLCVSQTQLNYLVRTYVHYYNHDRPHQGIGIGNNVLDKHFKPSDKGEVKCREFLGGLLKSYYREAA